MELTKRCNMRCKICFYRHSADFNQDYHKPLADVQAEVDSAVARGCKHITVHGWGEPMLYRWLHEYVEIVKKAGLTFSFITNGSFTLPKYKWLYENAMNHLHLSTHGIGEIHDQITEIPGAYKLQRRLKEYLKAEDLPFRTNTTLQIYNYKILLDIISENIFFGAKHVVLLGFLPHYEWHDRLREVAVHPAELRPYIERSLQIAIDGGALTTLRYHPFCHIDRKYWPYITNTQYVIFDSFEWDYNQGGKTEEEQLGFAINSLPAGVAIWGKPCVECKAFVHCGGWNRHYAREFNGADLKPIKEELPQERGYFFLQNPANQRDGWF